MFWKCGRKSRKSRGEKFVIFETELFVRDTIRINILKELMAGSATLAVQLNDCEIENYATQIHNDMGRVRVYGNFNMAESIDGEVLTIRPISVDRVMKAVPAMSEGISGKEIAIVRSSTKQVENTYPFDETFMGLELVPSENKYILKLEYADNVQTEQPVIQDENPVIQEEQRVIEEEQPVVQNPVKDEKIQKIEEELKKDYKQAEVQLEECKTQLEIDKRVLEYYQNKDVKPVEEIFKEIQQKLDEAEKQIALFIQAQQKKTMEIEGS